MKKLCLLAVAFGLSVISISGQAADADAARALMKKSDCFKCHSVDKKKDGPPFMETAAQYRDEYQDNMAEAEQALYIHLTTTPMVEIDGVEEEHPSLKTKNDADINNVVQWILLQ